MDVIRAYAKTSRICGYVLRPVKEVRQHLRRLGASWTCWIYDSWTVEALYESKLTERFLLSCGSRRRRGGLPSVSVTISSKLRRSTTVVKGVWPDRDGAEEEQLKTDVTGKQRVGGSLFHLSRSSDDETRLPNMVKQPRVSIPPEPSPSSHPPYGGRHNKFCFRG